MTFNLRVFLWAVLIAALFMNFETWRRDYPAAPATAPVPAGTAVPLDSSVPTASAPPAAATAAGAPGTAPAAAAAPTAAAAVPPGEAAPEAALASAASVHVVTDVLDIDIGLIGGELRRADLIRYARVKGQPEPVRLLNRDGPESLYVLQSGLAGAAHAPAPTHLAEYTASARELRLDNGARELRVPLSWTNGQGVSVTKTFVFRRGSYQIDLEYAIRNGSGTPWLYQPYAQLLRHNTPVERSMFDVESYSFKGPAYFDGTKYQKLAVGDEDSVLDRAITGGWVAALQHHFVSAIVPPAGESWQYRLKIQGEQFLLSTSAASGQVAPGGGAQLHQTLFVGPKLQSQLDLAGPRLDLVADYGMLTTLARPLFWVLEKVHALVGNWGFTIIIVTFLLKLLFYPLSEASGKSMARMKTLAPRMKNLQELYKGDREKLGRATMEMYRKEKVNPLAGCLPMLIQIPVFLAFYWVLLESVEMRQAPFLGWINDLSSKDPFYILPAIMAGAMFVQFKLNPQMGDPVQQKIMMIMPLAMSVTFAFFPSGLVLYWVTNTVLSILQQWNINRRIEAQAAKARS
ncbi:MAG: membrane protein insertase YidC [Gammaproteobacteria bacterium]|nr:membrane protein insertase YidC [Gammaproteobacteria bacterium]